jgi:hypothetical protein
MRNFIFTFLPCFLLLCQVIKEKVLDERGIGIPGVLLIAQIRKSVPIVIPTETSILTPKLTLRFPPKHIERYFFLREEYLF